MLHISIKASPVALLLCSSLIACSGAETGASGNDAAAVPSIATPDEPSSSWQTKEEKSAMGDRTSVVSTLESQNMINNSIGSGEKAVILLRCVDNQTDFLFVWPSFVGSMEEVRVEYKVDDGPIQARSLAPSNNGSAFGFWGGGESIGFLRSIYDANILVVRASGWGETSQEAIFQVNGVKEAAEKVAGACGWDL